MSILSGNIIYFRHRNIYIDSITVYGTYKLLLNLRVITFKHDHQMLHTSELSACFFVWNWINTNYSFENTIANLKPSLQINKRKDKII